MSTLFVHNEPVVEEWLTRRRQLGQDGRDEVWEGVYHVAPYEHVRNSMTAMQLAFTLQAAASAVGLTATGPFNLGAPDDYRIPDLAFVRDEDLQLYMPTAVLVVEVLPPATRPSPRSTSTPPTASRSSGSSTPPSAPSASGSVSATPGPRPAAAMCSP